MPSSIDGCDYGRGTRWTVGILAAMMAGGFSVVMAVCMSSRGAAAQDISTLRQQISDRAVAAGVLEERLAGIDKRLERIETGIERLGAN